jgi:hypothetical protein
MNAKELIKQFEELAEYYEQHYARIDVNFVTNFFNKHIEKYAEAKAKEAWNAAIDAAAEVEIVKCGKCEMLGESAPCDECYYGGNTKSKAILNLKK